ncbi:MAG: CopD family protein [Anaerolineae bacterium]
MDWMGGILHWLHLLGIVAWVGGLFFQVLVMNPALGVVSPPERGKFMGAFMRRWMPLVWGAVALVGITGILEARSGIGLAALFSSSSRYANLLLLKIALVTVMIILGAIASFVLIPRLMSIAATGPPTGGPPAGPPPEVAKIQNQISLLAYTNFVLGILVLLVQGLIEGR